MSVENSLKFFIWNSSQLPGELFADAFFFTFTTGNWDRVGRQLVKYKIKAKGLGSQDKNWRNFIL